MTISPNKDLCMFGSKEPSFTKGKEYEVLNNYPTYLHDQIKVIDDQGDEHYLGVFFTKFKIVKR